MRWSVWRIKTTKELSRSFKMLNNCLRVNFPIQISARIDCSMYSRNRQNRLKCYFSFGRHHHIYSMTRIQWADFYLSVLMSVSVCGTDSRWALLGQHYQSMWWAMNVSRVWITSPNVTPTVLSYTRYNQPPRWRESDDVDIQSHLGGGGAAEMSEIYNMIILAIEQRKLKSRKFTTLS